MHGTDLTLYTKREKNKVNVSFKGLFAKIVNWSLVRKIFFLAHQTEVSNLEEAAQLSLTAKRF